MFYNRKKSSQDKKKPSLKKKQPKQKTKRDTRTVYDEEIQVLNDNQTSKNMIKDSEKTYSCNICNVDFYDIAGLDKHEFLQHIFMTNEKKIVKKYVCDYCDSAFYNKDYLSLHLKRHTPTIHLKRNLERNVCVHCNACFMNESELHEHVKIHELEISYICDACGLPVTKTNAQKKHICLTEHVDDVEIVELGTETDNFSDSSIVGKDGTKASNSDYNNDIQVVSDDNNKKTIVIITEIISCNSCHLTFNNTYDLEIHKLIKHKEDNNKKFDCSYCNKSFSSNVGLMTHLKTHASKFIFKYSCDCCNIIFQNITEMLLHKQINGHFKCDLCSELFNQIELLTKHKCDVVSSGSVTRREKSIDNGELFDSDNLVANHLPSAVSTTPVNLQQQQQHDIIDLEKRGSEDIEIVHHKIVTADHNVSNDEVFALPDQAASNASKMEEINSIIVLNDDDSTDNILECSIVDFSCETCHQTFDDANQLQNHEIIKHRAVDIKSNDKRFKCDYCSSSFIQEHNFKLHMKYHGIYKCDVCDKSFDQVNQLTKHKMEHNGEYSCDTCDVFGRIKLDKTSLILHKRTHRIYECEFCERSFSSHQALKLHQTNHCVTCGKEFDNQSDLDRHNLQDHFGAVSFSCEVCDKVFSSAYNKDIHMELNHTQKRSKKAKKKKSTSVPKKSLENKETERKNDENTINITCDLFGNFLVDKDELIIHTEQDETEQPTESVASPEETFSCQLCNVYYSSLNELSVHKTTMHQKGILCTICGNNFSEIEMRIHMVMCSKKYNKLLCDICGKPFDDKEKLRIHKEVHKGKNEYFCKSCFINFLSQKDLETHINHVSKKTIFKCDICFERFHNFSELNQHRKIHSAKMQYSCKVCKQSFKNHVQLVNHKNSHVFSCDGCNEQFHSKRGVTDHKKFGKCKGTRNTSVINQINCDTIPRASSSGQVMDAELCNENLPSKTTDLTLGKRWTINKSSKVAKIAGKKYYSHPEVQFSCSVCNATFSRKDFLDYHETIHSVYKTFTCEPCNKVFNNEYTYASHKNSVHKDPMHVTESSNMFVNLPENMTDNHTLIEQGDEIMEEIVIETVETIEEDPIAVTEEDPLAVTEEDTIAVTEEEESYDNDNMEMENISTHELQDSEKDNSTMDNYGDISSNLSDNVAVNIKEELPHSEDISFKIDPIMVSVKDHSTMGKDEDFSSDPSNHVAVDIKEEPGSEDTTVKIDALKDNSNVGNNESYPSNYMAMDIKEEPDCENVNKKTDHIVVSEQDNSTADKTESNPSDYIAMNIKEEPVFEDINMIVNPAVMMAEKANFTSMKDETISFDPSNFVAVDIKEEPCYEDQIVKIDPKEVSRGSAKSKYKYDYKSYLVPQTCNICGKTLSCKQKLKRHMRVHTGEKPYSCGECGKTFAQSCELVVHSRIHTGEKPHPCTLCEKSFRTKWELTLHMRTHTGEKPHICEICDKSFTQRGVLTVHMRKHTGEMKYSCTFCDKAFYRKETFDSHLVTHTGNRPFSCDQCDKSYNKIGELNTHKKTHSNERPYACQMCDKTYRRVGDLNVHMRTHTGEKPYKCDLCEKAFAQSFTLVEHRRLHTGEKPYSCAVCNKAFAKKSYLTWHEKKENCAKQEIKEEKNDFIAPSMEGIKEESFDDTEYIPLPVECDVNIDEKTAE